MQRRRLLGAIGSGLAMGQAGCVSRLSRARRSRLPNRPEEGFSINVENYCNPADAPLLALLSDEPGDPDACHADARPSLAIENGREGTVDVQVTIDQDDGLVNHYALAPGERIVETQALAAAAAVEGSVTVDGTEEAIIWPERSCRRHGIALSPREIEIGWIAPLSGPADTQHACYPGDPAPLRVSSADSDRAVEVAITDTCADTTATETFSLDADATHARRAIVQHGGEYVLDVAVDDRPAETFTFADICWGIAVHVDGDGTIETSTVPMD